MEFAKWFRPLCFLLLTGCIHVITIATFQTSLSVYDMLSKKAVLIRLIHTQFENLLPILTSVRICWSISWLIFSALMALSLQLTLTASVWFSYNRTESLYCLAGAGVTLGIVFIDVVALLGWDLMSKTFKQFVIYLNNLFHNIIKIVQSKI